MPTDKLLALADQGEAWKVAQVLRDISDRVEDEGNRFYLGSTNDRHMIDRMCDRLESLSAAIRALAEEAE